MIGRENSRHSLNQSDPKLQTIVSESLFLIGYLQCLKAFFWLDVVISLGWFFDTQLKTALNVQSLCFKRLLFINKLLHTITPLLCLFLKAGKHNNSDWDKQTYATRRVNFFSWNTHIHLSEYARVPYLDSSGHLYFWWCRTLSLISVLKEVLSSSVRTQYWGAGVWIAGRSVARVA